MLSLLFLVCLYTTVSLLPVGTAEVKLTRVFVFSKTETLILKIIIGVACFGVAVGVILLGGALPGSGKNNKTLMCLLSQLFRKPCTEYGLLVSTRVYVPS